MIVFRGINLSQTHRIRISIMSFLFSTRSSKTFKPKKNIPEGTYQADLMK